MHSNYLMEHDEEIIRLELKTDKSSLERQARWAGIRPGMRVADIGCGPGKTTYFLNSLIQPNGTAVGIDASEGRIDYAQKQYAGNGIEFICKDVYGPLEDLGLFDFVWVRFFLEYHRSKSSEIVKNISNILKPGGILCLIDLDYNCLTHYGLSPKLEKTISGIMHTLEDKADFDPYCGRKLYSYLYDLGYEDIDVKLSAHHLIFGALGEIDSFNWFSKANVAAKKAGYNFEEYEGGFDEFYREFELFFNDPRRLTYTPVISCRGSKKTHN